MRRVFVASLCFLLLFSSCKKKDNTTSTNNTSTSTGTTSGGNNGTGTTTYDGLFDIVNKYQINNGSAYPMYGNNITAYLSPNPIVNLVPLNYLDIGNVSLNGVALLNHINTTQYYYYDSLHSTYTAPYMWNVTGSANMPAISQTSITTFPTLIGVSAIPDSISKASGFNIPISGLNHCDFMQIYIFGPVGSQFISPKIMPGNSTIVPYSPSELNGLITGMGELLIVFYNDSLRTVNGKTLNFRAGSSYQNFSFKIKS